MEQQQSPEILAPPKAPLPVPASRPILVLRAVVFSGTVFLWMILLAGLFPHRWNWLQEPGPPMSLLIYYVCLVGFIGGLSAASIAFLDGRSFRTLGLWFYPGWLRETLVGLVYGAAVISLVAALLYATGVASFSGLLPGVAAAPAAFVRLVAFLVLAAAFEELAFRGYAFQRLVEAIGPFAATVAASAFFGLAHARNPQATLLSTVNIALVGGLLAVAYLRTRGLWLPIGLHFAWNFFQGPVFSFPVSGYRMHGVGLGTNLAGPLWLTGGGFGPEGSALLTVVAAVAIPVLALARLPGLASSPGADLGVDLRE